MLTREEMKTEAVKRMRMLKMLKQPIKEFEEEDVLNMSEIYGALYWLDDRQNELVRKWEKDTGNMVYHVVHDFTDFGELMTLLYVSRYKEEWSQDHSDLEEGYPFCYVMNLTYEECSEYGSCTIIPSIGGVRRLF